MLPNKRSSRGSKSRASRTTRAPLTTPAPADRGHLLTERRLSASARLDALSIPQALRLLNDQDLTVATVLRRAIPALSALVRDVVRALQSGGRLIYLGAGTSGRLGVLDASECPPTFHCDPALVVGIIAGGDRSLRRSSEGAEDDPHGAAAELRRLGIGRHDVVVGIAAGGTTPYVLGALAFARRRGAVTALICCLEAGPPSAPADHVICLPVGPEVLTGSTRMKAGTATKLALNMISTAAMVQLGKAWGNLMVDLRATNAKLRDRAARIVAAQGGLNRTRALELLDRADGRVKVALVMTRRGVEAPQAEKLLARHGGRLRPILGPPDKGI
jgi:N-acetylmuramic acid 6-phosphate etherase